MKNSLLFSFQRLSQLQRARIDKVELQQVIDDEYDESSSKLVNLKGICSGLLLSAPKALKTIKDPSVLPLLIFDSEQGWGVLNSQNTKGEWIGEWFSVENGSWLELVIDNLAEYEIFSLKTKKNFNAGNSRIFQMVKSEIIIHKKWLIDASLAGIFINVIAVASAFYSMQVYDRVVPTGAFQTLMVLTIGVLALTILDFISKLVRAGLYEKLIENIDRRLSRDVYKRFLSLRMDQLPKSVGSLASQMRGYESVRAFLSTITTYLVVDVPFILFYVLLIVIIAGKLAFVPMAFFVIATLTGLYFHKRIESLADNINESVNLKVGLLVESVEGAETIKSGQGGWRMLSNWMNVTDEGRGYDLEMKRMTDQSQYMVALFQQSSFIIMVASGATMIGSGALTMGGLIACSILSGRILAPVAQIPAQLVQWANTKSAIRSLDVIWDLKCDHDGIEQPIVPENLHSNYLIEDKTQLNYGEKVALISPELRINPGEKIGVLGPIGSGKTSLLRLLSGMYKPNTGRVMLNDIDLAHISKPVLAENIGFLQQEGRLFKGTVRENLILGLVDPGDEKILEACKITGLLDSVISASEKGLEHEIFEGGLGLSGGQRQLVNLTRVVLRKPKVWLLDEPTASVDRNLEALLINMFKEVIKPEDTLVLVTHKMEMIELVDRLIVVNKNQIIMDGPKADVIAQLSGKPQNAPKTQSQEV
ncbi:MAG: ATP-binding cassette domain-containing protein [Gammaproteobacteria bacterium]|uniref:ABC transporter ATP-binding protein and permease n=1 Tax=endosymbiont of Bathymodiolus septemdierum str. Myojin knoll TaxID=1303921 RepID=A0A0P0USE9_9GAMM|nr:ATP-binding cassette domain-containing protein [Bathymodiolus septemdierum thioautotrophic gill symbiont]RUA06650.1 MAG: ATP-binding cassette domain-containing protein [Gammaproteobacteria bacterium]BAS68017.1 ABC transporter ATP-binding protein and permease [endosymbiont of Bathymodiolus septemdierum str. Myojin knoll]